MASFCPTASGEPSANWSRRCGALRAGSSHRQAGTSAAAAGKAPLRSGAGQRPDRRPGGNASNAMLPVWLEPSGSGAGSVVDRERKLAALEVAAEDHARQQGRQQMAQQHEQRGRSALPPCCRSRSARGRCTDQSDSASDRHSESGKSYADRWLCCATGRHLIPQHSAIF
jgi:hypothetical protein